MGVSAPGNFPNEDPATRGDRDFFCVFAGDAALAGALDGRNKLTQFSAVC